MARGLQIVRKQSELEALLAQVQDEMEFFPTMAFTRDHNGHAIGQSVTEEKIDLETARGFAEIRFGHRDGNTIRFFPRASDGNVHLYEYLR
jgi:hypothetical protein